MISRKLIELILGDDNYQQRFKFIDPEYAEKQNNNYIQYRYDPVTQDYININAYQLAHKCKKWAFKQGYQLSSMIGGWYEDNAYWTYECFITDASQNSIMYIEADSEFEAIFKACDWILENKLKSEEEQ